MDPLFQKTCEEFDEGGASGLLLHHLHMNSRGRIVFDASDVKSTESPASAHDLHAAMASTTADAKGLDVFWSKVTCSSDFVGGKG